MPVSRQPKGIPVGGQYAENSHDEAPALDSLSWLSRRALDQTPDYEGWVRTGEGFREDRSSGYEIRVSDDEDRAGWTIHMDGRRDSSGEFDSFSQAATYLNGSAPKPIAPEPKDPTLEPRIMEPPIADGDTVPHRRSDRQGTNGITRIEHWDAFSVGTGYFGAFVGEPDSPPAWSSDQQDFVDAAIIWQHRGDIDEALRQVGMTRKRRLSIHVEPDRLVISEYDHGEFRDVVVSRRDV